MAIAALAVGSHKGYAYIRGEYPLAIQRFRHAVAQCAAAGYLDGFEIEVRAGAGAYVCGEETALFASIEGYRGEPRVKPPFPTTHGLFGKPTLINNVETFANIPPIILRGGAWYSSLGLPGSKARGVKLFSVSGHVQRPGVYEVPLGLPLRQLIDDYAGGVRGRQVQAVLMGGAAGMFIGPDRLDTPLDFAAMQAAGATLGSGAVMVFNETVDLWQVARRAARFLAEESCGKCAPCRIGTRRQVEILQHMDPLDHDEAVELLEELGAVMADASICGLGQAASNAVLSALRLIRQGRGG
jgi:NADH-quinone oxidoreductase subunit F